MLRSMRRSALFTTLLAIVACIAPAAAQADSVVLSVTDPAAEIQRIVTVTVQASTPSNLFIKYRRPGGAACAPTPSGDAGAVLDNGFWYDAVTGNQTLTATVTFGRAETGSWMLCAWLASDNNAVGTLFPQPDLVVRKPTGSIATSASPTTWRTGETNVTMTASGTSEVGRNVFVKMRPAGGAACAPTASGDAGSVVDNGLWYDSVSGIYALSAITITAPTTAGMYLVCGWLATDNNDTDPIAASSTLLSVAAPPAPLRCVVPKLIGLKLKVVKVRLKAARCRLGNVTRAYGSRAQNHRVIKQSRKKGRQFPVGTKVNIVLGKR